jgi:hypothetical protein
MGDAETVAQKILCVNEVLGGLARIGFQMGVSALPHAADTEPRAVLLS